MYTFKKSTRKNKKYDVYYTKTGQYLVSFGDSRYQQFEDITPLKLYSSKNHYDKKRKDAYYKRHGKAAFETAKWFSHKFLW